MREDFDAKAQPDDIAYFRCGSAYSKKAFERCADAFEHEQRVPRWRCLATGCERVAHAQGLCYRHFLEPEKDVVR